ncbi:MAG: S1 RNA-binding domain-containing protein, partial [Clostridiaceae bacterium]|nr:S1 RNA-binding domain-containing protein [Clostridiaceae bacterium]
ELDVKVLRVDKESEKISLGLKQVLPNPWDDVEDKYPAGNIVEAKVVRLAPFGAFVQLEPGVEGLVHISHLAEHHVVEPGEIVAEGDVVKVKVLSVDPVEKRIRLSIREANGTDFQRERETKREKSREDKRTEPAQPKGYEINDYQEPVSDGSTVTIGEMVGNIFKDRQEGK